MLLVFNLLWSYTAVSCSNVDSALTCLYRNDTSSVWELPQWYIDDEPISPHSIAEYNSTVWRMVYDYSGLSPGEHIFHGRIGGGPGVALRTCCGPPPEVFLNFTVEAGEISMHPRRMQAQLKEYCNIFLSIDSWLLFLALLCSENCIVLTNGDFYGERCPNCIAAI